MRSIAPGEALQPGEGLLALHLRTDTPLHSIHIGGWSPIPFDVESGTHLRVIALPAGHYRWLRLELQETIDPRRFGFPAEPANLVFVFPYEDELEFRIDAGKLNYAGLIEVSRHAYWQMRMRAIDRTALALEQLRSQFPDFVSRFPMAYSGSARHVFLDHYHAASSLAKGSDAAPR